MATNNAINLKSSGVVSYDAAGTFAGRAITGTASRISLSNGDGTAGNPTIDIDAAYVGQASITTLGTIATGIWEGTTIAVDQGGTGQTTYTNGQLLIGNTTGNTLSKATLTAGTGITITNGTGTITIDADNNGTVTSVSGTASRISSTGGATPVIDIDAAYVGQASITTLGTIATGVWEGTDVGVQHGGTGVSTLTDGGILLGSGTGAITATSQPTNGQVLIGSTGVDPVLGSIASADSSVTITAGAGTIDLSAPGTGISGASKVVFMDDFFDLADGNEEMWDSAGGTDNAPAEAGHPGIVNVQGSTAGHLHLANTDCVIAGSSALVFETIVRLNSITAGTYATQRIGFSDQTSSTADFVNGAYFEFDADVDAFWHIKTAKASTRTDTATTISATTDWVTLKIVINSAVSSVEYFVDGVSGGTISTNIPTAGMGCMFQVGALASSTYTQDVDKVLIYNE